MGTEEERVDTGRFNNSTRLVAKNASFLMLSQLFTWGLALLLTFFLPRFLGPEGVGQLHLAESLWAIGGVFVSFGLSSLVPKEIARRPEEAGLLFSQTVALRLLLYLLSWGGILVYLLLAGYRQETVLVILIIGVSFLPRLAAMTARDTLQGIEQMGAISLSDVVAKLFNAVVIIGLLLLGQGVVVVAGVATLTALVNLLVQLALLRHTVSLRAAFDPRAALRTLRASLPYFSTHAFGVIYKQLDIIVISLLVSETVIGWYGAADRLFGTLLFVPSVLTTALFPLMSRLHEADPERLARLMRRSFNLLLLTSVPMGLGLLVVADNVAVLLFGPAFAPTGPVLAIMGLVTILTFQNILLARFAIAVDRQRIWAWVMVLATLATIPLDLLLVPWTASRFGNGALGGALAYIVTEGGMFAAGLVILSRRLLTGDLLWRSARVLAAGGLLVAGTWPLREAFLPIPVAAGALIYGAAVLLLGVLPPEERRQLRGLLAGGWARLRRRKPASGAK